MAQTQKKPRGPNGGKRPGAGRPRGARTSKTAAERMGVALPLRTKTMQQLALPYAEAAMKVMVQALVSPKSSQAVKLDAADHILNRAYGRPVQAHILAGMGADLDLDLSRLTEDQLLEFERLLALAIGVPSTGADAGRLGESAGRVIDATPA